MNPKIQKPVSFIARHKEGDYFVNLAGNYDYLELPYYISQDMELEGKKIHPTCEEMLDAYITPLFLEKAKINGLPIPEYYISNGYFEPPVIVDPINPFMERSRVVLHYPRMKSVGRSMTRNFTYAVCCQDIPAGASVRFFRAVFGWCLIPRYRDAARAIWEVFHIPLAKVRVIVLNDGRVLLSDISQLYLKDLKKREMQHLEGVVEWVE